MFINPRYLAEDNNLIINEQIVDITTDNGLERKSSIAVIIPCYNESKRLVIGQFINVLKFHPNILFCFVNDASTDTTSEVLRDLKKSYPSQVIIIDLGQNVGKAEAIRQGVLFLKQQIALNFIAYLDADLSAPLSELLRLYEIIQKEQLQFVFGSRVATYGSNIKRNIFRHYLGRVFATGASIVLNMPIYDTQCGLKVLKKDLAQQLFDKPFISRWLFDIEIIARLKFLYNKTKMLDIMKEIPLNEWIEKGDSRLRLQEIFQTPFLLFKIKYYYIKRVKTHSVNLSVNLSAKLKE